MAVQVVMAQVAVAAVALALVHRARVVLVVTALCSYLKFSNNMAAQRYAVIREGYVIDVVMWDEQQAPEWVYPKPHDTLILETSNSAGAGDWILPAWSRIRLCG
jgi:hypothetical protein